MAQIGPYAIVRPLGQGGMAQVFLAVACGASGFEKRVAIKMLLPELRGAPEIERLLIHEARLGAQLSHRNLVGVHQLGVSDGAYYVVMDYVDGADLATLLKRARPSPEVAVFVVEELLLALDYLHRFAENGRPLGLVHRDISPSNVLVSGEGEVKLADFGVTKATALADITRAGVRKGKYAYMSPEQVAGSALGPASDQFSVGVMMIELITGARPFDGEGPHDTMERIQRAEPPDVALLPESVRPIVLRALARDPRARFPSAAEFRGALIGALPAAGPPELAAWMLE